MQQIAHDRCQSIPLCAFGGELAAAGGGDRIEARLAIRVGHAPCATHEAALTVVTLEDLKRYAVAD